MVSSLAYFTGWLSMILVIIGIILQMFGSVLNTYGSYLNSIHHSYFYTHEYFRVAHTFPSLALYPHGVTEAFVFTIQYSNISNISYFYQPDIKYGKVLHQIGIFTYDSHHKFAVIQGIECEINCLNFCTL